MSATASQINSLTIVYSGEDQRNQSSASLAVVRGIHRWPVNSPHRVPVTRKMFPFHDVIMQPNWIASARWRQPRHFIILGEILKWIFEVSHLRGWEKHVSYCGMICVRNYCLVSLTALLRSFSICNRHSNARQKRFQGRTTSSWIGTYWIIFDKSMHECIWNILTYFVCRFGNCSYGTSIKWTHFKYLRVGWLVGNRGKTVVHCIKQWRTAVHVRALWRINHLNATHLIWLIFVSFEYLWPLNNWVVFFKI